MKEKINLKVLIHSIIGLSLMFFGRFLPAPEIFAPATEKLINLGFPVLDNGQILLTISPEGMAAVTIFAGTMYLWTLVNVIWPTFLSVILLGTCGYFPMPQVLSGLMGNPLIVMIFFLFIFIGIIIDNDIAKYLVQYIMTRKIIQGRPWVLTFFIFLATFIVGQISQIASSTLMWAATYTILNTVGYKKGDKYTTVIICYITVVSLLVFCTNPATGGGFYFLSKIQELSSGSTGLTVSVMPFLTYATFAFIISIICMTIFLFMMRFVYKIDVSLLKNFDTKVFEENKLPPMTKKHKFLLSLFVLYMFWLLLPSVLGTDNIIGSFLSKTSLASTFIIFFIALIVKIEGKQVVTLTDSMRSVPWTIYFLLATAFLLGGYTSNPITNVNLFMEYAFHKILSGMDYLTLNLATIAIGIVITNFANSTVVGLIMIPIITAICNSLNFTPEPVLACYFFATLFGAITPAASPYAALLYGNTEWVSPTDAIKHMFIASFIVMLVLMVVGIPLAQILF